MKVISPLDGGGQEVILTLIQGGVQLYFKAYFANFRSPLQIIIAQSLSRCVHNQKLRKPRLNGLCVGLLSRRDP